MWWSATLPGKKVFRVLLTVLDSRPKLLRPEMTADFELVEDAVTGGVKVPIEAVFSNQASRRSGVQAFGPTKSKSGTRRSNPERPIARSPERPNARTPERPSTGVVYVRKDGRFWPRTVELGARNDNDVLVTKGLKAGDVIAERLPPASLIGPAVRPERQARIGGLLGLLPWGLGK